MVESVRVLAAAGWFPVWEIVVLNADWVKLYDLQNEYLPLPLPWHLILIGYGKDLFDLVSELEWEIRP